MPPRLKVFRGHFGFYDSIVAATSQKEALKAWGLHANAFAQGAAAPTKDAEAVKAALASPGIVLRRPFGTGAPFRANPAPVPMPKTRAKNRSKRPNRTAQPAKSRARQGAAKHELEEAKKAELAALRDLDRRKRELDTERRRIEREMQAKVAKAKRRLH